VAYPKDSLKVHLILGASKIEVESSFPGVADSLDRFEGVSFWHWSGRSLYI